MQSIPRRVLALSPLLVLSACAATPALETSISGAIPAGRTYALVDGARHIGAADLPVETLTACLAQAGLTPATRPYTFVQIARTSRPANSRLLPPGSENVPKNKRLRAKYTREELLLAITDSQTGTLLTRASATRTSKHAPAAGTGPDLARAVCGLFSPARPAPAAVSR